MTEREKFEKFCDGFNLARSKSDADKYADRVTLRMWETWQAATKAAVPQWIPVGERLPDEDALVVGSDGAGEYSSFATFEFFNGVFHLQTDGLEASNYDGGAVIKCCFVVTHWMPLPAASEVK